MRPIMIRAAIVIAAAVLFATVLLRADQTRTTRERHREWTAPAHAAALINPLANRPETEAGGRRLFQQRCSTCHGDDARGTSRGPNLMATAVQAQSDGALFWKITTGDTRAGMPTFSFLPVPQRWQLVRHLRFHAHPGE